MKKLLIFLVLFLFSTNVWSETRYYQHLKYKNNRPQPAKSLWGSYFPQEPFYIGLGYGRVFENNTEYLEEFQDNNLPALLDINQQVNLFVGYNAFSFMALEIEYILESTNSNHNSYFDTLRKINVDTTNKYNKNSMWFTNFVLKYPYLYKHVPFVKLGVGYSKFRTSEIKLLEGVWDPHEERYSYNTKSFLLKAGVGYEYILTKNHSIQLEYNYFMSPKIDVKETKHDLYEPDLDKTITMKKAVSLSYSKINIAYKFSF